jgi:hypothetical protein
MYSIEAEVVRETPAAVLVEIHGAEEWIPKSQIGNWVEGLEVGDIVELELTTWIAKKKGIL